VALWREHEIPCTNRRSLAGVTHTIMYISNAYFSKNFGALCLNCENVFPLKAEIRITNVTMIDNTGVLNLKNVFSVVLKSVNVTKNIGVVVKIERSNIVFDGCTIFDRNHGAYWSTLSFEGSHAAFYWNTIYVNNEGFRAGAIFAQSSTLLFRGNVTFMNNSSDKGGAMALYQDSIIVLSKYASVRLIQNHARTFGEGLYVNEANDYQLVLNKFRLIRCFFQPLNYSDGLSERVFFMNNTAGHAGSDLYGGWGDLCTIKDVRNNEIVKGNRFFNAMFMFASNYKIYSTISSNPTRICVCKGGIPQCNITVHNVMAFPGEKIQILAVSVGQRFGITPSTVYAEAEKTSNFEVLDIQHAQTTSRVCMNLTYSIRSASDVEVIKLVIDPEVDTIATTLDARLASSLNLEDMVTV